MGYDSCTKIAVIVFNIINIGVGIAGVVLNSRYHEYDYYNYYYYPSGVLFASMILGIIGCILDNTIILLISFIVSYVLVAGQIAGISVVWVAYGHCASIKGYENCKLPLSIAITNVIGVCLILLLVSASLTVKLRRLIVAKKIGSITVTLNQKMIV